MAYDGQHPIGSIIESADGLAYAFDVDERPLGAFGTRRAAFRAVCAAAGGGS